MKTIPNIKELNGARVLERGTSFIAKQIIMHMVIYAFIKRIKPLKDSHGETLVWKEAHQQLYTIGARQNNNHAIPVQVYYTKGHKLRVLVPRVPLTEQQTNAIWEYYETIKDNPYQFGNFAAWITYLKSGIWLGRQGDQRNYCFELVAKISKLVGYWLRGKDTDRVSIYDIGYEDEWYVLTNG